MSEAKQYIGMNQNEDRIGYFTSSKIVALTSNGKAKGSLGKPAYTYIDEKNWERRSGISMEKDVSARPLIWGKLGEVFVFGQVGLEYTLDSQSTVFHPEFKNCWSGSTDAYRMIGEHKVVAEIKAPFTRKSFFRMADCLNFENPIEHLRETHDDGEKYYWQIVSNACIHKAKFGELIFGMPYKSELQDIRDIASGWDNPIEQKNMYWVMGEEDETLPYINEGGYYKNIYKILFEIPQADKDFLEELVSLASNELEPFFLPKTK